MVPDVLVGRFLAFSWFPFQRAVIKRVPFIHILIFVVMVTTVRVVVSVVLVVTVGVNVGAVSVGVWVGVCVGVRVGVGVGDVRFLVVIEVLCFVREIVILH